MALLKKEYCVVLIFPIREVLSALQSAIQNNNFEYWTFNSNMKDATASAQC